MKEHTLPEPEAAYKRGQRDGYPQKTKPAFGHI